MAAAPMEGIMKRNGKVRPQRVIHCPKCQAVLNVQRDLRTRAVRGHKDVLEMGLQCWRCKQWMHIYFSSPEVDVLRTAYRKAQRRAISTQQPRDVAKMQVSGEAYRQAFDELNGRLRAELKIVNRLYVTGAEEEE